MTNKDGNTTVGGLSADRRRFLQVTAGLGAASVLGVNTAQAQQSTEITDWHDLDAVRDGLDEEYVLVNDLDETTSGYDEQVADPDGSWEPIGDWDIDEDVEFSGTFDGNGHEIAELEITRPDQEYVGLFAGITGTITDVTLAGLEVTGQENVGGLIGRNTGEVVRTSVSGDVTGQTSVGGLAGFNNGTVVQESSARVDVTGERNVGGLLGFSSSQDVEETFVNGDITGQERVGGLIGWHEAGEVSNSFATGDIDANSDSVGGLVGRFGRDTDPGINLSAVLAGAYWDTTTTGTDESVGEIKDDGVTIDINNDVAGLATEEMQGNEAELNMEALYFDETWQIVADPDDYPILQWQEVPDGEEDELEDIDDADAETMDEADDDVPGFGFGGALLSVGGVAYLLKRRLGTTGSDTQ